MDIASAVYADQLGGALAVTLDAHLVGCYLHGSAVLGGFDARRSDVDVLVVVDGRLGAAALAAVVTATSQDALPCPALGLELSIITAAAARRLVPSPPFELHVSTTPGDEKVVPGAGHPGDPDLVLHQAVCRAYGRGLGGAPRPDEVFAEVPRVLVLGQLGAELRWAMEHGAPEYAVLNACRAWRFAVDDVLVSKGAGGRSARDRVLPGQRRLVDYALAQQRLEGPRPVDAAAIRAFVGDVVDRLRAATDPAPPG